MRRSADDGSSSIAETGRLFLRNLPYSATEDDIRDLFSEYGELSEVHLVLDRYEGNKTRNTVLLQSSSHYCMSHAVLLNPGSSHISIRLVKSYSQCCSLGIHGTSYLALKCLTLPSH